MNSTTTVFYEKDDAKVICSLKLKQKLSNDPDVEIISPSAYLKPTLLKIQSFNTSHQFIVHNVKNGSFVDFVNSIALCILKSNLPIDISVAAHQNCNIMVYSPISNRIEYFYSENLKDSKILQKLKEMCIENYNELLGMNK